MGSIVPQLQPVKKRSLNGEKRVIYITTPFGKIKFTERSDNKEKWEHLEFLLGQLSKIKKLLASLYRRNKSKTIKYTKHRI